MLRVNGISKTYIDRRRSITAIEEVDLEVGRGEALGLIGPSGSGKSTLLQVIAGLVEPTSGSVDRDGDVGLAFQQPLLYPWLTVSENIGLALRFAAHRDADPVRIDSLLDEFGLVGLADARPSSLSGGQAQRVALARGLVTRPRALLLDEPFAALDPAARTALQDWMRQWHRSHDLALVLVTHDVSEALLVCDRVGLLLPDHPGLVAEWAVPELSRDQITTHPLLAEILATYQTDVASGQTTRSVA